MRHDLSEIDPILATNSGDSDVGELFVKELRPMRLTFQNGRERSTCTTLPRHVLSDARGLDVCGAHAIGGRSRPLANVPKLPMSRHVLGMCRGCGVQACVAP